MKCACILAAGTGSRLKKYTQHQTKCMVEVAGDRLIDHTIQSLNDAGINVIFIVIGYFGEGLVDYVKLKYPDLDIHFIWNKEYANTNNIYSLKLALPKLTDFDEVILIESDLWIRKNIAVEFIQDPRENIVLASPFRYWMDGTCVTINSKTQSITGFIAKTDIHQFSSEDLYKTVNWYKFSGNFLHNIYSYFINAYVKSFGRNAYYEDVLKIIASTSPELFTSFVIDEKDWMEIDDEEDLSRANLLAAAPQNASSELVNRFGGFWKFPFIEDLTLLVNPFFPTEGMMYEFSNIVNNAIREYPSKQLAIARVANKIISCELDQIAIGNGLSELMMILFMEDKSRQYLIAPPFFMEYQRLLGDRLKIFPRNFPEVSIEQALDEMVNNSKEDIILINPNNPTGELCNIEHLIKLLNKLKENKRRLIVDESFIDFSNEEGSLLSQNIIDKYPNLIILKSFGKSYGVPGLRLGVIVSSNTKLIEYIRRSLPIWNISSAAEVFLDLLPRYKKEYKASLVELKNERVFFENSLKKMGIDFYPSNANFVFFQIKNKKEIEFDEYCYTKGFLVKKIVNRSGLNGLYYRIAVRRHNQNLQVLKVLSDYVDKIA
jgi:histidinol-phosphate/aromatic aminotransferase/cobyric acid decarboxylase-like protein/choline kinase